MTQQSPDWAHTLRRPSFKETDVPCCSSELYYLAFLLLLERERDGIIMSTHKKQFITDELLLEGGNF